MKPGTTEDFEDDSFHQGRILNNRCQIDFRDIRSKARKEEVNRELARAAREAIKGGSFAWRKAFGEAKPARTRGFDFGSMDSIFVFGEGARKKNGIIRRIFARAHNKLNDKISQLKHMVQETDAIGREENFDFNCKVNQMTDKFYHDLEILARKNQHSNSVMMKQLNKKNLMLM